MKRIFAISLTLALLFSTLVVGITKAALVCDGRYGVRIYMEDNFDPPSKLFCANTLGVLRVSNLDLYATPSGGTWNDVVSSIRTYNALSSTQTRFYVDKNYLGSSFVIIGNNSFSGLGVYNDRISSFKNNS